jgi:hypothetical protein
LDQDKLRNKAAKFHRLFTSPDGKLVLQDLEDELNPDVLIGKTSEDTAYNVGRRDAFVYIQQLIRYEENVRRQHELERQPTG